MKISRNIAIPDQEVELMAIRAQGPGGQNVNKVSSAIHLRFDIRSSSLPESCKIRLLRLQDHRITNDGVIIIKAQNFRNQEKNREEALERLKNLVRKTLHVPKKRKPTKPSQRAEQKRLDAKTKRGQVKKLRNMKSLLE